MALIHSRRRFLVGAAAATAILTAPRAWAKPTAAHDQLTALEKAHGGHLGVAMLDVGSGARIAHRGDERFPMCSTFKFLAAAHVLARVDRKAERLDRRVVVAKSDLVTYSPVTEKHLGAPGMSLAELCNAAVTVSDNAAGNLLLETFGGPAGLTAYVRTLGDRSTRLDRNEPALNEAARNDPRDTTTPSAMLGAMHALLVGKALSPASRAQLIAWLVANTTGDLRLRAGLPKSWRVGDKTGTGDRGATNDIAIAWPPGRADPLLIAAYYIDSRGDAGQRNRVLAEVGRIAAATI